MQGAGGGRTPAGVGRPELRRQCRPHGAVGAPAHGAEAGQARHLLRGHPPAGGPN